MRLIYLFCRAAHLAASCCCGGGGRDDVICGLRTICAPHWNRIQMWVRASFFRPIMMGYIYKPDWGDTFRHTFNEPIRQRTTSISYIYTQWDLVNWIITIRPWWWDAECFFIYVWPVWNDKIFTNLPQSFNKYVEVAEGYMLSINIKICVHYFCVAILTKYYPQKGLWWNCKTKP